MKTMFSAIGMVLIATAASAQTTLWKTDTASHKYYRIPAIVAYDNHVIAFSDNRSGVTDATSWGDVGSVGNISVEVRHSDDGGKTWTAPRCAAMGFGCGNFDQSHGDAAVVRDRETGRMLFMTGSGEVGYGRSKVTTPGDYSQALKVGRYYSIDNGYTWNGGDVTSQIYGLYRGHGNIFRLFFTSGRICQSRLIKCGSYYRIYSAVVTNEGSLVVYSDDFGRTWIPLGGADVRPAPQGDEAKIEELPDGRVLLSCRRSGKDGRWFNIFTYTDRQYLSGRTRSFRVARWRYGYYQQQLQRRDTPRPGSEHQRQPCLCSVTVSPTRRPRQPSHQSGASQPCLHLLESVRHARQLEHSRQMG